MTDLFNSLFKMKCNRGDIAEFDIDKTPFWGNAARARFDLLRIRHEGQSRLRELTVANDEKAVSMGKVSEIGRLLSGFIFPEDDKRLAYPQIELDAEAIVLCLHFLRRCLVFTLTFSEAKQIGELYLAVDHSIGALKPNLLASSDGRGMAYRLGMFQLAFLIEADRKELFKAPDFHVLQWPGMTKEHGCSHSPIDLMVASMNPSGSLSNFPAMILRNEIRRKISEANL